MIRQFFLTVALLMAGVVAAQEDAVVTPQVPAEQQGVPAGVEGAANREITEEGKALPSGDVGAAREDAERVPAEQPPAAGQVPATEHADAPGGGAQEGEGQPTAEEQGATEAEGEADGGEQGAAEPEGEADGGEQGVAEKTECDPKECGSGCSCGCQAAGEQGAAGEPEGEVGEGETESENQSTAEEQGPVAEPEGGADEGGQEGEDQPAAEEQGATESEGDVDGEEQEGEEQSAAEEQGAAGKTECDPKECGSKCSCGCQAAREQGAAGESEGEAGDSKGEGERQPAAGEHGTVAEPAEGKPGKEEAVPAEGTSTREEAKGEQGEETEQDLAAAYRGIVKIEVANRMPDYNVPWRAGQFGRGTGTGFMVAPGIFMTNAHVVGNAERINVSPYADARKIPAKVRFVAHDADLALVEVEDAEAFRDVPYLEFSTDMPKLEDSVRAIGYPIGGNRLSVTRGIVSRIDTIPYAHTQNETHLTVQIDAAINPGNSGGPVLMGDKVVGVAFQGLREANSTGYMIPLPVINRFRKDVQDGHYDCYVKIGAQFFPMENPAMREHYKLPDDAMGAVVGEVIKGSAADGKLQVGDVVLAVNGIPVDSSAMIELGGERVKLEEMAERAFSGDVLTFSIIRDGKVMAVKVAPQRIPAADIMGNEFDAMPRYVHFAGLIFQPLQRGVIEAHRMDPGDFVVEMDEFINRGGSQSKEDVVVLTDVLADEVNSRFDDSGTGIVTKVNGQEVKGLRHLHELLYPKGGKREGGYTTIEFKDAPRPFVIDNAVLDATNERISNSYNIPANARLD